MEKLLLAGDVGGTKTVLAIVSPESGTRATLAEWTYENRLYSSLDEVIADFLGRCGFGVGHASLSVAGPVEGGRAIMSNLGWRVEAEALCEAFGIAAVHLVNDLQATAYAVPHLSSENILTLQAGQPRPYGPRGVIAPGTGLGEAFLMWEGTHFESFASEGGNADFAPADYLQVELLRYLRQDNDHVSVEMVCSGIGLPNIYRFLRDTRVDAEPEWLAERLAAAVDPAPVIAAAALDEADPSPICIHTLQMFASVLAAEAGNMALRLMATGGIFVGGGIPPRILPVLRDERFVNTFRSKGRFAGMMRQIPLHVVLEPRTALLGAAQYGLDAQVHTVSEMSRATRR
jgi:glucokinase